MANGLKGELTVVYSCMFGGKTKEIHRLLHNAEIGHRKVQFFKPEMDTRYGVDKSVTHDRDERDAIPIKNLADLVQKINPEADLYAFDELQFFTADFIPLIMGLYFEGKDLVVGGLNLDYKGEIFFMRDEQGNKTTRSIHDLINIADNPRLLEAVCTHKFPSGNVCGKGARYSQRFMDEDQTIVAPYDGETIKLGEANIYAARCPQHFKFYKESGLVIPK